MPFPSEGNNASDRANIVLDGSTFNLEQLVRIARDPNVQVSCGRDAVERVIRAHTYVLEAVESQGSDGGVVEYGITTGFGEFKDIHIGLDKLNQLQRNLILSHATGVGNTPHSDDLSNYFPADAVRATLLFRLNTFLRGNSGISLQLLQVIERLINRGVIPLVPIRGSVGSSGDLAPLAHLFLVLLGKGRFYVVSSASDVEASRPATIFDGPQLSSVLGMDIDSDLIGPKAGLALINGAAFAAASLALAVHDAERLADAADVAVSLTLEGVRGCSTAFHPLIHQARPFPGQITSAGNVRALTRHSQLIDSAGAVQDAYSIRCAPQVHGASRDVFGFARKTVEIELNSSTDNPLLFPDESGLKTGRLTYSAGNFHGQPVGLAADFVGIACAELASIAERRTQLLLDRHHNRDLPANLTPEPGLNSGMMIAQYAAASLVSENKVLAHPASVDSIPTSANSEDHVSMATIAARKARTIVANAEATVAIEMMAAAQAIDWRVGMAGNLREYPGTKVDPAVRPDEAGAGAVERGLSQNLDVVPSPLGIGTAKAHRLIREVVTTLVYDRPMDGDIRAIWRLMQSGAFTTCLQEALAASAPDGHHPSFDTSVLPFKLPG